ncbi:MAG: AAA family ATPase [Erysipelotrichaceae bacterium]|nr:AAA family ATPase [Erysipelotrichaceae bacterium]
MKNIKKIVCTGGPCSGKTTLLTRVQEIFEERGYRVFIDHEAATDLITGGISPATMGMYEFQKYCIALQMKKEELFMQAAEEIKGDNVLVFCDRGILDDKGYVSPDEFTEILKGFNTTEEEAKMNYDMVLHLTTAAKGAEEAYTLSNNEARYETIDQARAVDDTILASWEGHPNRVIIGNESEFEAKIRKAIQAIFGFLGGEKPVEIFKKYLVNVNDDVLAQIKADPTVTVTHITQYFLQSIHNEEKRVRKREKDGNTLYYYSEANLLSVNTRIKRDRMISEKQYVDYLAQKDESLNVINKDRYGFIHDNLYFKLDVFDFDKQHGLLSVQIPSEDTVVDLPDYVDIIKDVSTDPNYKNYYLAKNNRYL